MILTTFFILNTALLFSSLFALRIKTNAQLISLSLLQVLACLPLLSVYYLYIARHLDQQRLVPLLFLMESTFALLWLVMSCRLSGLTSDNLEPRWITLIQAVAGAILVVLALYGFNVIPLTIEPDGSLISLPYSPLYFFALALLLCMLAAAWRMEVFWRSLATSKRWEYKFLVVGSFIVCAALGWAASYRITYQRLAADHFTLLAALVFIAWAFIVYATARHRLLNRRVFISRKIVFSFIAPGIFGVYLFSLGLVSLIMRAFNVDLPFVLFWLASALGLIAVAFFLCSGKLRRSVHFFISTHFYINKYEYRDEWLALSAKLQGALTETDIARALYEILTESFYTTRILVWLGDRRRGYTPLNPLPSPEHDTEIAAIAPQDHLITYLEAHPCFYIQTSEQDPAHQNLLTTRSDFLTDHDLVLLAPLKIGDQLVGIIGLGPEFTGGRYGHDDYDLLAAIGTQTASAIVGIRAAEELANARERQAWDRLSAFVLHDVKNAASMLSLVQANAPHNIHHPEFQQDMLEAVDDALSRMAKVQQRLNMLQEEITPTWADIDLCQFLQTFCQKIRRRLSTMTITLNCPSAPRLRSDPQLLSRILENLLLNAIEAAGEQASVHIEVQTNNLLRQLTISIADNGPGILPDLLPETLFTPFKTTKPHGTGIGLWQVKQLTTALNGTIQAENLSSGGARIRFCFPS
jgi:putative PEP-CTERM system histidine kinase